MTIVVIDVFEIIHIKHNQHPTPPGHLRCPVQIAALAQKSGKRIQLIPHLGAIDIVQHRQQRDAQPGNAQIRCCHLNNGFRRQEHNQGINQRFASVLKRLRPQDGGQGQIKNRRKIRHDINIKMRPSGIHVVCTHRKYQSKGDRARKEQQIGNFAAHCKPNFLPGCRFLVLHIHQADCHRRRQSKSQKIGRNVQPPIFYRCAIHHQRYNFHDGNAGNQCKRQQKSPFLLLIQGFTQPCKDSHKAQS